MSEHRFWLSEGQFARLEPLLPNKPRGGPRIDDRRVIIHIIRGGLMWRDTPAAYGPSKTLYNRFIRRGPDRAVRPDLRHPGRGGGRHRPGDDRRHPPQSPSSRRQLVQKGVFPVVSAAPRVA